MSQSNFSDKSSTEAILDLRADKLAAYAAYANAEDNPAKLKEHLRCLEEGIDYLRLVIKYQSFDLEATRRENAELRAMLDADEEEY